MYLTSLTDFFIFLGKIVLNVFIDFLFTFNFSMILIHFETYLIKSQTNFVDKFDDVSHFCLIRSSFVVL